MSSYHYGNYDIALGRLVNDGHNSSYSSGASATVDIDSQTKKLQKVREMESNIPKRALMLRKLFDKDFLHLPKLPDELWLEIAKYEGGVESSLLGLDESANSSSWFWCNIL